MQIKSGGGLHGNHLIVDINYNRAMGDQCSNSINKQSLKYVPEYLPGQFRHSEELNAAVVLFKAVMTLQNDLYVL